jgi:hypothetical protein
VRFPPRAGLPPGTVIQRIPALGTSWYERRFSYWARRLGAILLLIVAVAIYAAIISGPISAAGPAGSGGFLAALFAEIAFCAVTGVLMFRHLWQLGISGRSAGANTGQSGRLGGGLGLLASSVGGVVGAFLVVVAALVSGGVILAALAIWLLPVPPAEQYARGQLTETLQHHGHEHKGQPVANRRSKHPGSH